MARGQSALRGRNAGNGRFMPVDAARSRPSTATVEGSEGWLREALVVAASSKRRDGTLHTDAGGRTQALYDSDRTRPESRKKLIRSAGRLTIRPCG